MYQSPNPCRKRGLQKIRFLRLSKVSVARLEGAWKYLMEVGTGLFRRRARPYPRSFQLFLGTNVLDNSPSSADCHGYMHKRQMQMRSAIVHSLYCVSISSEDRFVRHRRCSATSVAEAARPKPVRFLEHCDRPPRL